PLRRCGGARRRCGRAYGTTSRRRPASCWTRSPRTSGPGTERRPRTSRGRTQEGGAMKIASLAFLTVLFLAHCAGDPARVCGLPLSMFRDGDWAAFGYALFALLLAVAGLMIVTLLRGGLYGQVGLLTLAALLLLEVAVTSSYDAFHLLCSLVLFALLYAYY